MLQAARLAVISTARPSAAIFLTVVILNSSCKGYCLHTRLLYNAAPKKSTRNSTRFGKRLPSSLILFRAAPLMRAAAKDHSPMAASASRMVSIGSEPAGILTVM